MKKEPKKLHLPPCPTLKIQQQTFWKYIQSSQGEVDALHNWLQHNQQAILQQLPQQPGPSIQELYIALCHLIQIQPHTLIQIPQNSVKHHPQEAEPTQVPQHSPNDNTEYLVFQNAQIDIITLKLLHFLWPFCHNLQVLKVYNLAPTKEEVKELCLIVQQHKVSKFFFEYINTDQDMITYALEQLPKSTHLEQLWLRGNRIYDDQVKTFVDSMETNITTSNLKYLELSTNQITKRAIKDLSNLFKKQNQLEYLGLAKNNIQKFDDLKDLTEFLIRKRLSPEELHNYRELEVKREEQQKKILKLKNKKLQEQLIILEPLFQAQDGAFYTVQNQHFKILNISMNQLGDSDKDQIDRFLSQVQDSFLLVVSNNNFEAKVKEKLKKKYKNVII